MTVTISYFMEKNVSEFDRTIEKRGRKVVIDVQTETH